MSNYSYPFRPAHRPPGTLIGPGVYLTEQGVRQYEKRLRPLWSNLDGKPDDISASVDLRSFNVLGDGENDDSLGLELASQVTDRVLQLLPGEIYRMGSSRTLHGKILGRGGIIRPDPGVIITIEGSFEAGLYQCFDTSAGGSVILSQGAAGVTHSVWWGGEKDTSIRDETGAEVLRVSGGAASGRVLDSGGLVYNVRGYGIRGTPDDLVLLQSLIDSVPDGSTLVFPRGSYVLGRLPGQRYGIRIKDRKGLHFRAEPGARFVSGSPINISDGDINIFEISGSSGLLFSGFEWEYEWEGTPSPRSNARLIYIYGSEGDRWRNIELSDNDITYYHPLGSNNDTYNIALYGFLAAWGEDLLVRHNTWRGCEGRNLELIGVRNGNLETNYLKDLIPQFLSVGFRILTGCQSITMSGNTLETVAEMNPESSGSLIQIGSGLNAVPNTDITIDSTNTLLVHDDRGSLVSGIHAYGVRGLTIDGPKVTQTVSTGASFRRTKGIYFSDTGDLPDNEDVLIRGVRVRGFTDHQIRVDPGVSVVDGIIEDSYLGRTAVGVSGREVSPTAQDQFVIRRTSGYRTVNRGSAFITAGNTQVTVNHGLRKQPDSSQVLVTSRSHLQSATQFWVSDVTATQFQINVDVPVDAGSLNFSWRASVED